MRALYFDGKEVQYREDAPRPVCTPGHSLIRILAAAICNTDQEILRGYRPRFRGILGHEFVGLVEESEDQTLIGKRVVGELNEGCGKCIYCKSGREKHCPERKVIGMEQLDGCFAEYMVLATHLLHVVPDELPTKTAVFAESLAAALEIPNRVHLRPSQNVAILGDGRLAYMITQVVALSGAELTIIGKHPEKLESFRPFGHAMTLQEATARAEALQAAEAAEHTDAIQSAQATYEVVIDATGNSEGLRLAAALVRRQGTIVMKSTYAGTVNVDMSYFVVNEITIKGSRCGPFEPAMNLLRRGRISLPQIEFYALKEYKQAFSSRAFKAGFLIDKK